VGGGGWDGFVGVGVCSIKRRRTPRVVTRNALRKKEEVLNSIRAVEARATIPGTLKKMSFKLRRKGVRSSNFWKVGGGKPLTT